jgi:multimeric flavodoxin WrbA
VSRGSFAHRKPVYNEVAMKVTSILGSPRKKGNTNKVLQWIEEALQEHDHGVDRINIVDHKVNGCKGCFTCKKSVDSPGCPQKDGGAEIMGRMMASDIILYASPIYFWGPTAQLKTLIDRHCCLVTGYGTPQWQSLVSDKRLGLVVTCEDGLENNIDLMEELFKRFVDYLKCYHAGTLVIPFATKPGALGAEAQEQAHAFARRLMAPLSTA